MNTIMRSIPILNILADNLPMSVRSEMGLAMETNDWSFFVRNNLDRNDLGSVDPVDLFDKVFINELFRKADNLPLGVDTAQAALSTFLASEAKNEQTNVRLIKLGEFVQRNINTELSQLVLMWRKQVKIMLGDAFVLHPKITLGASSNLKRGHTVFQRLSSTTLTSSACAFLTEKGELPPPVGPWKVKSYPSPVFVNRKDLDITQGNVYDTVPKTALTDRGIAKEPVINIAYQGAIGNNIRLRCLDFGLDITRAQDRHRDIVAIASAGILDISTLDLSAASDSVTTELCKLILPHDWFDQISAFRSEYTFIPSGGSLDIPHWHKNHMVSSMGNGFTFELETVIFLSLMLAITGRLYHSLPDLFSVYGDDIIIPSGLVDKAVKSLNLFGFDVNESKSFSTGFFRESCGADFFKSTNVRGYNASTIPTSAIELIRFINGVRRVCYYNNDNRWRHITYCRLWFRCVLHLEQRYRVFGPRYLGDSVIHTECDSLYNCKVDRWGRTKIKVMAVSMSMFKERFHEHLIGVPSDVFMMSVLSGKLSGTSPWGGEEGFIQNVPSGTVLDTLYRPTWQFFFFEEPDPRTAVSPSDGSCAIAYEKTGSLVYHPSKGVRNAYFFLKKREKVQELITLLRSRISGKMDKIMMDLEPIYDFESFTL